MLKRILKYSMTVSILSIGLSIFADQNINRIAAIVNKDIITQDQLDDLVKQQAMQARASGQSVSLQKLQQNALNNQIDLSLQLQLAKNHGITLTDTEVTQAIQGIATRNHMTLDQLKQQLQNSGMSFTTYRKMIRDQILASQVRNMSLQGKVNITPADIKQFKAQYDNQLSAKKMYNVEDILIPFASDSPSTIEIETTKQKAVNILAELELDKMPDLTKFGATTNDLGWTNPADLPTAFLNYVATANVNTWSQPLQTENGYHLIKVSATKSDGKSLTDAELKEALFQKKYSEAATDWLKQLRSQSYIKIMDQ